MKPWRIALLLGAVGSSVATAWAATGVVKQTSRSFSVAQMQIKRGDTIRFSNADEFIHHVYVDSPSFKFTSDEQEPGKDLDVVFPTAGTFDVRCQIHPRMLLRVTVQ